MFTAAVLDITQSSCYFRPRSICFHALHPLCYMCGCCLCNMTLLFLVYFLVKQNNCPISRMRVCALEAFWHTGLTFFCIVLLKIRLQVKLSYLFCSGMAIYMKVIALDVFFQSIYFTIDFSHIVSAFSSTQ